jgi:hypothetical protein
MPDNFTHIRKKVFKFAEKLNKKGQKKRSSLPLTLVAIYAYLSEG